MKLPQPLPSQDDPDTEISVGAQDQLPVYCLPPRGCAEGCAVQDECLVCKETLTSDLTLVWCHACHTPAHVRCMAHAFLSEAREPAEILPREGSCPNGSCGQRLLWSRLVRDARDLRATNNEDTYDRQARPARGHSSSHTPCPMWVVDDSSGDEESDNEANSECEGDDLSNEDTNGNDRSGYGVDEEGEAAGGQQIYGQVLCLQMRDSKMCDGNATLSLPVNDEGMELQQSGAEVHAEHGDQEMRGDLPTSPPIIPLADRLRLRRLNAQHAELSLSDKC